jgi:PASTA domain
MADAPKPAAGSDFLKRKLGPFPMPVVIGAGLLAAYWLWTKYEAKGKTTATAATTAAATAGTVSGSYSSRTWSKTTPATSKTTAATTATAGTVAVPNVVGLNRTTAFPEIEDAGLVVSETPTPKAGVGYTVASTSPAAGKQVAKGSTVTVTIKQAASGAGNPAVTAGHATAAPKKTPRKKT